ncbi:MAG: winged helix-turn-helix transcriptional regulator [Patescibacteria group bacterium]
MTEETAQPSVVSEPVVEPAPIPEPVAVEPVPEPQPTEPTPTAQPVEPLEPEPISEPEPIPEPTPEPVSVNPEPLPVILSGPLITKQDSRSLLAKARDIIQFRKRKKLEKIMNLFLKKQSITNDEVEKLLHISDATATRYLDQLEREGKIQKQGNGKYVSYVRI